MLQDRKTPRDSRKRRYAGALAAAVLLHGIPSAGWVHPYQPPHVRDSAIVRQALESNPASRSMDTLTLAFIGDVMLHQAQIAGSLRDDGSHDFTGYFSSIADDLAEADIATANMEFTLAGEPYTGYPSFSAPDSYAEYMAECGIDVFLTANNHILDKGEKGLDRTIRTYRELERKYGVRMTGCAENEEAMLAGYPLMMSCDGLKIAFINFTYGTNTGFGKTFPGTNYTDMEKIAEAIKRAEDLGAGLIIALPHWGEEYSTSHSGSQEKLAQWLADKGVGLIVGTHPHVVQDTGIIGTDKGEVPVIYSLGNAISNMSARNTQIGLMLEMKIIRDGFGEVVSLEPCYTFLWTSLPGRLAGRHCTVKVKDMLGKRDEWISPYEYDKMVSTYSDIKEVTGIED